MPRNMHIDIPTFYVEVADLPHVFDFIVVVEIGAKVPFELKSRSHGKCERQISI